MQTEMFTNLRKVGISFINDIPWGTHICSFYETKKDLIDLSSTYFKAGLENNEFCMWIISEPVSTIEAFEALKTTIPNFETYLPQIEIITHSEWYLKYGNFQCDKVLEGWITKVNHALSQGYEGLRICGCTTWLNKRYWKSFVDYEAAVERKITQLKMIALCPYQLDKCGMHEILDVVTNHQFSFICSKYGSEHNNSMAKIDRLNLMGQMAAGIAHEIRNPMTSVKGFIQLLQGKKDLAVYNDYFNIMIDELDRANGIITEYLSMARDKDKIIQPQNLNSILNSLLPLIQANALKEDKNVLLDTGEIRDILVDPKDIRQVVLNISRNGLESMGKGGVLEITTHMEHSYVILKVKDSGLGIPEDLIEKLGTPFLTTKENGTGLGIFVSYKILDSYKAKIKVKSSPTGTIFTIIFPEFKVHAVNEEFQAMEIAAL